MDRRRPIPARVWGVAVLAALLLGAALFLRFRASSVRAAYEALAAQTPVVTMSPPPLAFRPVAALLRVGSIGPEVMELQRRLAELGYYQGDIDGKYYAASEGAVKLFQAQHGLDADGIAGEATLRILMGPDAKPRGAAGTTPTLP
ncbi:MAG TPA: peptidoglycan-binding domain-containing protein, partial [Candidatus Limnocylindria bacterium]|nr:peptidoglycan-binding domain-containing protein [Candidatus Limnocylindria bacterium]